jgi:membrane protein
MAAAQVSGRVGQASGAAETGPIIVSPETLFDLRRLFRWRTLVAIWNKAQADDLPGLTAEVTYYALFALFPFLLFVGSLTALLVQDPEAAIVNTLLLLHRFLPAETADLLTQFVATTLKAQRPDLMSVGVLGTLWACSNGFTALIKALNRIYGRSERRSWWRHRALALAMAIGAGLVAIMLLVVLIGADPGGLLSRWLAMPPQAVVLWGWLRWPVALFVLTVVLAMLYCKGPCGRTRWQWITPGGLAASILWVVVSAGLTAWIDIFGSQSATYGAIGGVIVLLGWIYLGAFLVLLGAEANVVLRKARMNDKG